MHISSWFRTSLALMCFVVSFNTFAETLVNEIEIAKAEIFMPQNSASATGSKMTIYNRSGNPLIIDDVTSARFKQIMLHATRFEGGKREMYPVQTITVAAHHTLALTPNTSHIMLAGFTQPLQMGDLVNLTLHTNQGELLVIARVVPMHLR